MTTKKQWLLDRMKGLSGTDASAIIGRNPWKTNIDVWEEKMGRPSNISSNDAMIYGTKAEKPLFTLFKLDFPQYKSVANGYDIVKHDNYPFLIGTPDGFLTEKETGRKGILEIKTSTIINSMAREKWKDQIPENYYIQVLHYMLVNRAEFAIVKAQLKSVYGEEISLNTKHYYIERKDVINDMIYLMKEEVSFWHKYIIPKIKPDLLLPAI